MAENGAHPRSRGENSWRQYSTNCAHGSSPLTRGKRKRPLVSWLEDGLIPAHAGKTPTLASRGSLYQAHPRSRGENHVHGAFCLCAGGSSPLTRGKPAH